MKEVSQVLRQVRNFTDKRITKAKAKRLKRE